MTTDSRFVVILVSTFLLGAALTYLLIPPLPPEVHQTVVETPSSAESEEPDHEQESVRTVIRGAGVKNPGSYHLSADSEVKDLIEKAGGLTDDAVAPGLPVYDQVFDGLEITIPSESRFEEILAGERPLTGEDLIVMHDLQPPDEAAADDDLIDLNSASAKELQLLPGIGESFSERIVRNRESDGPFDEPWDVKRIVGIGEKRFDRIEPYVTAR